MLSLSSTEAPQQPPEAAPPGSSTPLIAVLVLGAMGALTAMSWSMWTFDEPAPSASDAVVWTPTERALIESLSPPPSAPPASSSNRVADDPEARTLGHALFFDARLSANGAVSCASCHQPEKYFTDGKVLGEAIGETERHTPTLIGAAWSPFVFWDGRRDSLWSQSLGPLESDVEHGLNRVALARLVYKHHQEGYEAVFGELPELSDEARFPAHARPMLQNTTHPHHIAWVLMSESDREAVDRVAANVGKALEAYQRALVPRAAPFDDYVAALKAGDPEGGGHLSLSAQRGLRAFVGKAQCINCHNGPLLSDQGFHNLGLTPMGTVGHVDMGRSRGAGEVLSNPFNCAGPLSDTESCDELKYLNPLFEDFMGAFKTPTLRNVAMTAPYMHTGQFETLGAVVGFYRSLPGKAMIGHRELVLELLDPSVSAADLVAFLESLTGPLPDARWLKPPGSLAARDKAMDEPRDGSHGEAPDANPEAPARGAAGRQAATTSLP